MASFVRPVVAGSWERCAATGASVDGRRLALVRMDADELDDYRSRHPLAVALPVFRELPGGSPQRAAAEARARALGADVDVTRVTVNVPAQSPS